jgi:zinc transport system substrate-binding protein
MWEPEEVPNARQWAELEGILKDHPATWMLWEGEPARATVERLRALGIDSRVVDPCANRPAEGDFLSLMTENASNLERIFEHEGGEQ